MKTPQSMCLLRWAFVVLGGLILRVVASGLHEWRLEREPLRLDIDRSSSIRILRPFEPSQETCGLLSHCVGVNLKVLFAHGLIALLFVRIVAQNSPDRITEVGRVAQHVAPWKREVDRVSPSQAIAGKEHRAAQHRLDR